jgi:glycine hydroxymethyltransferase
MNKTPLHHFDPELFKAIANEAHRQEEHLELIASENYVSSAVLEAQGSIMTNKYAEGYPGRRYYGGCEFVDIAEKLALDRVKQLFDCDYANVQPHSGSQANNAVFQALLQPGDTFLGMDLSQGGHLTHGSPVNFSGKIYRAVHYGLNEHDLIDYDQVQSLAMEHKPKLIIGGFSAYSGIIDWKKMRDIADEIGAYLMVDMAHIAGLVAGGVYPSPLPHAHVVTSTTHKTLRGPRGGLILAKNQPELAKKIDSAIFPGTQGGPLMHIIAAKAVAFKEALQPDFKIYTQNIIKNAHAMVETFKKRGYKIVSNQTENHLFLIDLRDKTYSGKEAENALGRANITVNKNSVPHDTRSPMQTSGIRIGTPALTTRGFMTKECEQIAQWVCDVLDNPEDENVISRTRQSVVDLCQQFPVYVE